MPGARPARLDWVFFAAVAQLVEHELPKLGVAGSSPVRRSFALLSRLVAMSESEPVQGFTEGQPVWVEDGDGKQHPGIFVGENESASWFGGGPSAYVVHPEAKRAEVVSMFRITPRDE